MKKLIRIILLSLIVCCSNTMLYAQSRDQDGDGVFDEDDLCPSVAGTKENKGCPAEKQVQVKEESELDKIAKELGITVKKPTEREINAEVLYAILSGKDYKRVLEYSNEYIKNDPNYAPYYYSRGEAYQGLNNYANALSDFEKSIQLDPANKYYYTCKGKVNYILRNIQPAISDFTNAIRLDPSNADNYFFRGLLKSGIEDPQGAIADFSQAILKGIKGKKVYLIRGAQKSLVNDNTACEDLKIAKDAQVDGADNMFTICGCK